MRSCPGSDWPKSRVRKPMRLRSFSCCRDPSAMVRAWRPLRRRWARSPGSPRSNTRALESILGGKNTVASMADAAVEQIRGASPSAISAFSAIRSAARWDSKLRRGCSKAGRVVKFLGILDTSIVNERRDYRETFSPHSADGSGPIASTFRGSLAGRWQKLRAQSAVRRALPGSLIAIVDGSSTPPASGSSSSCRRYCGPGLSSNGWPARNQPCRSTPLCSDATEREYRNRSAGIAASQAWT